MLSTELRFDFFNTIMKKFYLSAVDQVKDGTIKPRMDVDTKYDQFVKRDINEEKAVRAAGIYDIQRK